MSNNIFVTLVGLSFWPARGVMSPARAACICHPASRTLQRGAGGKTLFEHQRQWFGNPLPGRTLVLATPCCGSGGCSHGKIHRGLSGKPHRNWEDLWLAKLCLKGWRCVAATKWCSKDPYFFPHMVASHEFAKMCSCIGLFIRKPRATRATFRPKSWTFQQEWALKPFITRVSGFQRVGVQGSFCNPTDAQIDQMIL